LIDIVCPLSSVAENHPRVSLIPLHAVMLDQNDPTNLISGFEFWLTGILKELKDITPFELNVAFLIAVQLMYNVVDNLFANAAIAHTPENESALTVVFTVFVDCNLPINKVTLFDPWITFLSDRPSVLEAVTLFELIVTVELVIEPIPEAVD